MGCRPAFLCSRLLRRACRNRGPSVCSRADYCRGCCGDDVMHRRRDGFTLIELLVVITIIAVLTGLAFGVFGAVNGQRDQASSASRMRQWGVALGAYAADNNGDLPRRGQ